MSEAPDTSAAAEPTNLVKAIVRRGTVVIGPHGEETHVGPGGEVLLPEEDVAALRASGVLHDPDSLPSYLTGPSVDNDLTEPSVTEAKAAPVRRKR